MKSSPIIVLMPSTDGNRINTQWGLDTPVGVSAAWGARVLAQAQGRWDVVSDRRGLQGGAAPCRILHKLLFEHGAYDHAAAVYQQMYLADEVNDRSGRRVILLDHPILRIEADTRGSGGYVYLVAYLQGAKPTAEALGSADEGKLIWSREDGDIPDLEDTIYVRQSAWATTGDTRMTVLGYGVECGHLFGR